MLFFDRWKNRAGQWRIGKTLRETFESFSSVMHRLTAKSEDEKIRFAMQSLVCSLLQTDGFIPRKNREIYQRLLEEKFDHREAEKQMDELQTMRPLSPGDAAAVLQNAAPEQKQHFLDFLLSLTVAIGDTPERIALLQDLAGRFCISWEALDELRLTLRKKEEQKRKILSSGWGVLAALLVLLVFVLTAKWLMPVIFGLIIACILLPVEKFFERRIQKKSSPCFWLIFFFHLLFYPLQKLSSLIRRKDRLSPAEDNAQRELKARKKRIVQATIFTFILLLLIFSVLFFAISRLTRHYVTDVTQSVSDMETERQVTGNSSSSASGGSTWASRCDDFLARTRDRFEAIPPIKAGITFLQKKLQDPLIRQKLLNRLFGDEDAFISLTTGLFSGTLSFLCDLLLTVFFSLLFLTKLAEFCHTDNSDKQKSEYLIRMIFNGIWLPDADETIIQEAKRIIEGVFFRLRVWLRGYLTLVAVDATVYTTLFAILDLPFFLPLGMLAGCGIMLPYIGPVISCCVTLAVTLAAGSGSGFTLAMILICYLCYNGIVEQFILYPAVIGESIGLSTLETIIVVLLGAIFAGIPGMILALPVASVAKYIIPQCYRSFLRPETLKRRKE